MNEFRIPSTNIPALEATLGKLNKKAAKLGMPLISLEIVKVITVKENKGNRCYSIVRVTGETPTISGWKFLASVDHVGGKNIINNAPGVDQVPSKYRDRAPFCDHCQTRKVKKYSYLIQNRETMEVMQVGKTCLKDFFDRDVSAYVQFHSAFTNVLSAIGNPDADYYYIDPMGLRYDAEEALAVAFKSTRLFGYHKSVDMNPTKNDIGLYFCGSQEQYETFMPEDEDLEKAALALAWVRGQDSSKSDFIATVQDILEIEGGVPQKYFGYIAGIVPFYENAQKKMFDIRNEYVGKVKQRLLMKVKLVQKRAIFSEMWGSTSYLHKFIDDTGHLIIWFASSDSSIAVDECVTVKATVKKHDEYNGVKQTSVNRVTVQ